MITGTVNVANCVPNNKRQRVTAANPVISVTPSSLSVQYLTGCNHIHSIPHTSIIFTAQGRSKHIEAAFFTTVKFCYHMI